MPSSSRRRRSTSLLAVLMALPLAGIAVVATAGPAAAAVPPGAPMSVMAYGGDGMASLYVMPGDPGDGMNLMYNASCTSSMGMTGGASSPSTYFSVMGLTNGAMYTCSVSASSTDQMTMSTMTSGPTPSNSFMPMMPMMMTPPSAPRHVGASPGDGQATVHWTAPASSGTAAVGAYVVTPYIGFAAQTPQTFNSVATTQVVTGLTNGTTYRFRVAAASMDGTGPMSGVSNKVVAGAPAAPTAVTLTKVGKSSIRVSFTAPANNGAKITSYTATCLSSNGGVGRTKIGKASPILVGGLTPGKKYFCTVVGTNSRGTGKPSAAAH